MVVAYATAKKYSFTGAASTVKGDEIAKLQTSSVSRALEGTVAGLQPQVVSRVPMPQSVFAVSDPSMHPVHLSM